MWKENKFCVRATAPFALFTLPEFKSSGERRSAHFPTYEALKGMLAAVYSKPELCIIIDRVRVMKQARFVTMGVNEMDLVRGGKGMRPDGTQQVAYTFLRDVEYIIEFHLAQNMGAMAQQRIKQRVAEGGQPWNLIRYIEQMERHISGHPRRNPCMGISECLAVIEPYPDFFAGKGDYDNYTSDLGITYHGINYPEHCCKEIDAAAPGTIERRYANLRMVNGVIQFPKPNECTQKVILKMRKGVNT